MPDILYLATTSISCLPLPRYCSSVGSTTFRNYTSNKLAAVLVRTSKCFRLEQKAFGQDKAFIVRAIMKQIKKYDVRMMKESNPRPSGGRIYRPTEQTLCPRASRLTQCPPTSALTTKLTVRK